MVFSLILSVGLPIGLCIFIRKKKRADFSPLLIGIAVFIMFAMTLEQMLHAVVLSSPAGDVILNNIFLYGIYGGLAAAIFEEVGRFVSMKFFLKTQMSRENAMMYGVGHGGAEAVFLVGMSCINNLSTATMINGGSIQAMMDTVPAEQQAAVFESISTLWTTPSYQFFLAGVERVFAIVLQIALSVLVYEAVKYGKMKFLALAMAIHFTVNCVAVIATRMMPLVMVEVLVCLMTAGAVYLVYRIYKKDESGELA